MEHSEEYLRYLESPEWKLKRDVFLHAANYSCSSCGMNYVSRSGLEIHHKHYDTLKNEKWEDILVLCVSCHEAEHERISKERQRNAAINTFGRKKYGEDWQNYYDVEEVEEEFDDWLYWKQNGSSRSWR